MTTARYPGYDVLEKWSSADFDHATREVVRRRVAEVPQLQFFTAEEMVHVALALLVPKTILAMVTGYASEPVPKEAIE